MSMFSFNNKFKNATLNKGEDGCYRLNVFYESTDEFGNVDLIEINDIPLYFSDYPLSDISVCSIYSYPEASVNLGFGELNFDRKTKLKRKIERITKIYTEQYNKLLKNTTINNNTLFNSY